MDVAIGLKARTGRAVIVALGGTPHEPQFVERGVLPLLPEGAFAPYHAAEKLDPAAARESVRLSIAAANDLATTGTAKGVEHVSSDVCSRPAAERHEASYG